MATPQGEAVMIRDGSDVALGSKADAAATDTTSAWTAIALLKGILGASGGGGAQAVTIADGADVTLGAKADAKSTATDTTAVSIMQVLKEISFMEQNPASRAVTNAGTFATQSTQAGTWTVQPGNTPNTTAWKVDGSAVTQPVSGTVAATQSGNWTARVVGNAGALLDGIIGAATAAAGMVQVGGVFTTGGVTLTSGQAAAIQLDSHASQKVSLYDGNGTVIDPTLASQVYWSNSYNNITSKTTTVVKSGAGRIQGIQCNTTGTADTLTVYDNTAGSGTKIATITAPLLGALFCVGAAFGTGLTIVSGGTTAGDYTVYYT